MGAAGYIPHAIAFRRKLGRQLSHFKNEIGQALSNGPHYAGTGLDRRDGAADRRIILEGERRFTIPHGLFVCFRRMVLGPESISQGQFKSSRHRLRLRENRSHSRYIIPYIEHYIGFDVIRENVEWCEQIIDTRREYRLKPSLTGFLRG